MYKLEMAHVEANIQVIELNIQDSVRKQIAQELRISLSTQCPCVVACYQCFYYNGAISIVLEYMDGGSLADFLNSVKTIPEPYLAAICKQVSVEWGTQLFSFELKETCACFSCRFFKD